MQLFIISVRDSAADAFHAPLFFPAIGMAERWFRDECNSQTPDAVLAKHPEDYELVLLGSFETVTGEVIPHAPRSLLRGADSVRKPS